VLAEGRWRLEDAAAKKWISPQQRHENSLNAKRSLNFFLKNEATLSKQILTYFVFLEVV
jgi:hypothetical protein